MGRLHENIVAVEKQYEYYICVCVSMLARACTQPYLSSMQRACTISAASLSPPYFSTLSHTRYDFRKKKVIKHKIYVFNLSTTFL